MSMNRVPGWASRHGQAPPGPRTAIWDRRARRPLAPMAASPSSIQTKRVEVRTGSARRRSRPSAARRPGSVLASRARRASPRPTSVRTIASPSVARRELLRRHDLRCRLDVLVLAREVHPEQHAAELARPCPRGARPRRCSRRDTRHDPVRIFSRPAGLRRARSNVSAGPRAVPRARVARDDVPEVVEPAVRVGRVELRALRIDRHRRLVDEDVRVESSYGTFREAGARGPRDPSSAGHGRPPEDDLALCGFELRGHGGAPSRS